MTANTLPAPEVTPDRQSYSIPLDRITPNPANPRAAFDNSSIAELADTLDSHGLISPIEVTPDAAGNYVITHGERRYRAAKIAGWQVIPAFIVSETLAPNQMLERALVENLQREDMTFLETAAAYAVLYEAGLSFHEISRRVGKHHTTVAQRIKWLKLDPEILALVNAGRLPTSYKLREALEKLPPASRVTVAKRLAGKGITLDGLLAAVEYIQKRSDDKAAGIEPSPAERRRNDQLIPNNRKKGTHAARAATKEAKQTEAAADLTTDLCYALRVAAPSRDLDALTRLDPSKRLVVALDTACRSCAMAEFPLEAPCRECPLAAFAVNVIELLS